MGKGAVDKIRSVPPKIEGRYCEAHIRRRLKNRRVAITGEVLGIVEFDSRHTRNFRHCPHGLFSSKCCIAFGTERI